MKQATKKATEKKDVFSLLKADHKKVKALFDRFEKSEDDAEKRKIAAECIRELKVHAQAEEEVFYPVAREALKEEDPEEGDDLIHEANEEHHVAKVLMAELEKMSGDEDNYCAKFTVLAENVRHHIKEEEEEMFPDLRKAEFDAKEVGVAVEARKKELMEEIAA